MFQLSGIVGLVSCAVSPGLVAPPHFFWISHPKYYGDRSWPYKWILVKQDKCSSLLTDHFIFQVVASGFGHLPSSTQSTWPPHWCPFWATSCSTSSQSHPEPVPGRCRSACCSSPSTLPTCSYRCWFSSRCCCPPLTTPAVAARQSDQRKESDIEAVVSTWLNDWFCTSKGICSF